MVALNYGNKHPQEVVEKINGNLRQIQALYDECENLAIAHGIDFSYSGPAGYGDGGYFHADAVTEWGETVHWKASSNSC